MSSGDRVLRDFNPILDPDFIADPLPILRDAWAESSIVRHDNLVTTYSIFAYTDVRSIFLNPDVFGSEMPKEQKDASLGALLDNLIAVDPPRHTRLRRIANTAFIPPVIAKFEQRARVLVDELTTNILEKDEFDVINDFAAQVTVGMITAILGLPSQDWPRIRQWTNDISNNVMADIWLKEPDSEREAVTARVTSELSDYFRDYIAERKRKPKEDDLISLFMTTEVEGERLSNEEIEGTAMLLLLAGNETTTNLIANFFRNMARFPDQAAMLRKNPELVRPAIEETLRFSPSLRGTARRVKQETELLGQRLMPGDAVFAWIATANRDSEVFNRPDEFDISRKPNRHIAFAAGPHVCLGAPLARLEARLTAESFANRIAKVELLSDPEIAPNAIADNTLSQLIRVTPA